MPGQVLIHLTFQQRQRYTLNWIATSLIKQFWLESGNVYGYRKLHFDLQDIGEKFGINHFHKLMKQEGIKEKDLFNKWSSENGHIRPCTLRQNWLRLNLSLKAQNHK